MAYGESNGHVIDAVTWLRQVKVLIPICLPVGPNISVYSLYKMRQIA